MRVAATAEGVRALARDALKRGGNVMAARVRGGGSAGVLPYGEGEAFYVAVFLSEFGIAPHGRGEFVDAQGERLVISDDVFRRKNRARVLKVTERGRERFVLLMADTIKRPDAIYDMGGGAKGAVIATQLCRSVGRRGWARVRCVGGVRRGA